MDEEGCGGGLYDLIRLSGDADWIEGRYAREDDDKLLRF